MKFQLEEIVNKFNLRGNLLRVRPYGNGHIHDTFLVNMKTSHGIDSYILQRINHHVFHDPSALMENIARVTQSVRHQLEKSGLTQEEILRRVLTIVPSHDELNFYRDPTGNYWRVFLFIKNACSYDILHSNKQVYEVAYMFGRFLFFLSNFSGPDLHVTIPDFHNGLKRWQDFQRELAGDSRNRAESAREEIEFLRAKADLFEILPNLIQTGIIPLRICHNDTKVNNVLLDSEGGEGLCVLDLDTVMKGTVLNDFGDLARSALNTEAEDSNTLSRITVEIPRFEALVRGFLRGVGGALTQNEIDYLVFGTQLMPLLIGTRFLTDYLAGDVYFKVRYPEQNLYRCRRQFKLIRAINKQEEEMKAVVKKYS